MNAAQTSGPAISIRGLDVSFATPEGAIHALKGVDLDVQPGEFIALIGPSGCGKTTLMRAVADLEQATSGAISIGGLTPRSAREARAYGYVFQAPALYPWRTIERNVALPLEIMGVAKSERAARAEASLAEVGLSGFEKRFPWQLSGGMQQRASIARALAFDAGLLLMDEPFGALDEIVRDRLNEQLHDLWERRGKTALFVTHSISEAVFLSTRIVVMSPRPGRIVEIVDAASLPRRRTLEVRETPEFVEVARKVREALRAGHAYD